MVAPPVAALSPGLPAPCLAVVEQPTEKALFSESTLSQLDFPDEFPYEFDSSPFTSPGDSTEAEDESSDDEEDFLAGLTRRLSLSTQRLPSPPPPPSFVTDKAEVKPANSPESTLNRPGSDSTSGNRSPNGPFSQVSSPPPSPFREEDSLKVISAAAGEVAKMKTANFDATSRPNPNPNPFIPFPQNAAFCNYYWLWNLQMQNPLYRQSLFRFGPTLQPPFIAPPFPVIGVFPAPTAVQPPSTSTCVFPSTTAVKTPSTGTGVFLPRSSPNPSDSRKKSVERCAKFRAKVAQQQNPKVKEFSGRYQPQLQACLSTESSKVDHEWPSLKPISCGKEEKPLPKEWPSLKPNSGGCLKEERPLPNEWPSLKPISGGCLKEERRLPQEWMY